MLLPAEGSWWDWLKNFFNRKARRRALYQKLDEQAANGDQNARYKLLMLYYDEGPEYYPLVFKWTVAVANQGEDCGVMIQAAEMYAAGHGVPPNDEKALLWFERSLSLHIMLGKDSPFSVEAANYIQEQIQQLRDKLGKETP